MGNFLKELIGPLFLLATGLASGYLRALAKNSPLAKPSEFFKYLRSLYKPAIWAFVSMFAIVFIFGAFVNDNYLEVLQKAVIAGLYTIGVVFVFMIWGVNLLRNEK
jgi:hypothetical protein